MADIQKIKKELPKILDRKRYEHSLRVEETAVSLAGHYKADVAKARLAGLLHDLGKKVKGKPKLLHAALSAEMAKDKFGVLDEEVLNAIRFHTQGRENMTLLEKIIYLSDHIEPGRVYPEVQKVRKLAYENLDQAIVASANAMLRHLAETNQPVDSQTIKTRDAYLK